VKPTTAQQRRARIAQITEQLIASQINKNQLDPYDDAALERATEKAAMDATFAYDAVTKVCRR
jgi:ribosome maturation protein Sdo1